MPVSVTMPRLGESVTEGTVTRWLKAEGDHVDADEPLLEVSTDKVDTEIPSPASGTLLSIKVREDETVEIGVELAVIGDAGDSADSAPAAQAAPEPASQPAPEPLTEPAAPPAAEPAPVAEVAAAPEPEHAQEAEPASTWAPPPAPEPTYAAPTAPAAPAAEVSTSDDDDEVAGTYVTPLVRKLASEHGVDLNTVQGTGVGGRIRKSDVLAVANGTAPTIAAPPAPARSTTARADRGHEHRDPSRAAAGRRTGADRARGRCLL